MAVIKLIGPVLRLTRSDLPEGDDFDLILISLQSLIRDIETALLDLRKIARFTQYEFKTTAIDLTIKEEGFILVDSSSSNITISLPYASKATSRRIDIKKISPLNTVTITPKASEVIDGASTKILTANYSALTIVSNGLNWYIK